MVAPITTNLIPAKALGNVSLTRKLSGLSRESVVLVCHVLTIDKDLLIECVARLPRRLMAQVDEGLRLALDLR